MISTTAVEQKHTPSTQGTRTEHGEAGAHRGRHPPHVDTQRREPQQQQEREQTCRPQANQAAVGKEIEQLSWLPTAQRILGSAAAGGTVATVVEAGGVGEYSSIDELPREDGSGGGEIPEVGDEYHHLRSKERAHKYTVSDPCAATRSRPEEQRSRVMSDEAPPRSRRAPARGGRRRRPPFSVTAGISWWPGGRLRLLWRGLGS